MEYEKDPLRLYRICSPEYPQKGTFALPNQTVVATTIEVVLDVDHRMFGHPGVTTIFSNATITKLNGNDIQWRAQQIAIGKATDNTNFQPIGVDWQNTIRRERAEISRNRTNVSKDHHQAHFGSLANVDHLTFVAQGKLASGYVCEVTVLVAYHSMFIGSDFLL
ncbi:hypothetical protein Tco_0826235 [Tanacetum coccineum]